MYFIVLDKKTWLPWYFFVREYIFISPKSSAFQLCCSPWGCFYLRHTLTEHTIQTKPKRGKLLICQWPKMLTQSLLLKQLNVLIKMHIIWMRWLSLDQRKNHVECPSVIGPWSNPVRVGSIWRLLFLGQAQNNRVNRMLGPQGKPNRRNFRQPDLLAKRQFFRQL